MIRLIDLAQAVAHAGLAPVRDGAAVTSIELEIAALSAGVPAADAIWNMRLRYRDPPPIGMFAGWRRARRRRAGVDVARIRLRWTPPHLDAVMDGRLLARLDFTVSGASPDEHPDHDA